MEWYCVCWPWLTAKRVEPVVSISWASCCLLYEGMFYAYSKRRCDPLFIFAPGSRQSNKRKMFIKLLHYLFRENVICLISILLLKNIYPVYIAETMTLVNKTKTKSWLCGAVIDQISAVIRQVHCQCQQLNNRRKKLHKKLYTFHTVIFLPSPKWPILCRVGR